MENIVRHIHNQRNQEDMGRNLNQSVRLYILQCQINLPDVKVRQQLEPIMYEDIIMIGNIYLNITVSLSIYFTAYTKA